MEQLYIKLTEQKGCLKKLKVITKEHLEVFYPANKKTDSKKFDTTLLFCWSTICVNINVQALDEKRIQMRQTSNEIADCIRLKKGRNRTQHEGLSMTTKQYRELYKYLSGPLLREALKKW